jgi:hypothetical protein
VGYFFNKRIAIDYARKTETADVLRMYESWRKLHVEELHNLYGSPSIIRMMKSIQGG